LYKIGFHQSVGVIVAVFVLSGYIVAGAAPGLAADVAVELGAIVCIIACIGGFIVAKVKANISL
jgi:hypothetical protein